MAENGCIYIFAIIPEYQRFRPTSTSAEEAKVHTKHIVKVPKHLI